VNNSPNDHLNLAPELDDAMQHLARINQERATLAQPFYDTLEWAGKRIGYQPPTSGITYVLAINNGFGQDIVALNSYFGGKTCGKANEATHVYAIERSTAQHEDATQHNSRLTSRDQELVVEPPSYLHFLNADAVDLPSQTSLPGEFHAVIIRHLDVSNPDHPWERVLHNALHLLAPNGIAVITTFNNALEDIPLRRFFFDRNYEVLLHDQNPTAQLIEETTVELDAIVSVIRKADGYQKPEEPALPASYSSGIVADVITREVFAIPLTT
jgi:SAM-dependent methyltransferase